MSSINRKALARMIAHKSGYKYNIKEADEVLELLGDALTDCLRDPDVTEVKFHKQFKWGIEAVPERVLYSGLIRQHYTEPAHHKLKFTELTLVSQALQDRESK